MVTYKMENLILPQIKENCKLALPDGLKELMSDITREVLRYQPRDLYKFIADYLSAMLITRDNLSIASHICNDIARCSCEPELLHELRDILVDLPEDEVKAARDIIVNYLGKGKVNEGNLLMILIKETNIDEDMLPAVQDAIRNAFLRHQAHNTTKYESSSDSDQDDTTCAARHTLDLYRKTAPNEETYGIMAEKIQKSYRAYGVKRESSMKSKNTKPAVTLVDPKLTAQMSSSYNYAFPKIIYSEEGSMTSSATNPEFQMSTSVIYKRISTMSSTSLAGSFVKLPFYKPYSAHDDVLSNLNEYPEREHAHIDYTDAHPHISMVTNEKLLYKRDKKISFSEATKKMGLIVDDDSESKDSNGTNESMIRADSITLYGEDVMKVDTNYDADEELERSDINVGQSRGNP